MHISYLYASVVILSAVGGTQAAQKRFVLEINNISCKTFNNHLKHYKCELTKVAKGRFILNVQLQADRNFGTDTDLHVRIKFLPLKGKTIINLIDLKLNLCDATSKILNNRMLQGLFNDFRASSNIPVKCPYKANVLYKANNVTLTDEFIPAYAPFGNISYNLEFFQGNLLICTYFASAALVPKK